MGTEKLCCANSSSFRISNYSSRRRRRRTSNYSSSFSRTHLNTACQFIFCVAVVGELSAGSIIHGNSDWNARSLVLRHRRRVSVRSMKDGTTYHVMAIMAASACACHLPMVSPGSPNKSLRQRRRVRVRSTKDATTYLGFGPSSVLALWPSMLYLCDDSMARSHRAILDRLCAGRRTWSHRGRRLPFAPSPWRRSRRL